MATDEKCPAPSSDPQKANLDARLKTLNEERAIFILRALLASEKVTPNQIIASIDLADALRIGNF